MITTRLIGALIEESYYLEFSERLSGKTDVLGIILDEETDSIAQGQKYVPVLVERIVYDEYADRNGFINIRGILALIIYGMDGNPTLDSNGFPILAQQEV